jgi:hypothetical protein
MYESHPLSYNAGHTTQHDRPYLHHTLTADVKRKRTIYSALLVLRDSAAETAMSQHDRHHLHSGDSDIEYNERRWSQCSLEIVPADEQSWPYPVVLHSRIKSSGADRLLNGWSIPITLITSHNSDRRNGHHRSTELDRAVLDVLYSRYAHAIDNPQLLPRKARITIRPTPSTGDSDELESFSPLTEMTESGSESENEVLTRASSVADDTTTNADGPFTVFLEGQSRVDADVHSYSRTDLSETIRTRIEAKSDVSNAVSVHMRTLFSSTMRVATQSELAVSTAMRQRALELQQTEHLMLLVSHFTALSREQVMFRSFLRSALLLCYALTCLLVCTIDMSVIVLCCIVLDY